MHKFLLTVVTLFAFGASALGQEYGPWPGGIVSVSIDGDTRPTVFLGENQVMVIRDDDAWKAIIGVPLDHDAATRLEVSVERSDREKKTVAVDLRAADYRVQRLNVDRKYVDPGQEALDRIFAERKVIDAALTNWREQDLDDVTLTMPVAGPRSSSFGSRRIFNDQPRSPHKGMDIAAVSGTPIKSPLTGVVTATGDFYFNGNTVIVDHGQGYVSLYCHLSEIDVIEGQAVATGDLLGKVGATGRVTGAHLHFATYLNGTAVDPALLLNSSD
jgi:murein DD-endopeptidase MepM/ murein hydrolase activator NlpD